MPPLTFEQLSAMGWRVHPDLGMRMSGFTSLAFEFHWDGLVQGVVQGYGATWEDARDDAVIQANRWLLHSWSPQLIEWLARAGYPLMDPARAPQP